jgi:hypothetical protein
MCLHGRYIQDIKKNQMMLKQMNFDRYLEVNTKGGMIYVIEFSLEMSFTYVLVNFQYLATYPTRYLGHFSIPIQH